jgi:hypothetical protein
MISSLFVFFGCEISADKFADEIRNVLGRFGFSDLASGRDNVIRSSRCDQDKFVADETAGAYRRNDVILEFHVGVQPYRDTRAIVNQTERFYFADSDTGDFYRVTDFQSSDRGEVGVYDVAASAEQLYFAEAYGEIAEADGPGEHKNTDDDVSA